MTPSSRRGYDIYGLGNALVDLEYAVDDAFLHDTALEKGYMTLVDEAGIDALMERLADRKPTRRSGGSAANTVFAVQGFGGRGVYSCRVASDDIGRHFLDDMHRAGIGTVGDQCASGKSGRCLTLVTRDAERTMTTFLGVSAALGPADIDEAALAASADFYVEGYLASSEPGLDTLVLARQIAEDSNVRVCMSFSDPSMVAGFRAGLVRMLGNGVHQLFCNEEEALTWARSDRLDIAVAELADIAPFVNVTLGARGSLVVANGTREFTTGVATHAVDTTGAGDIYAGAVIHARGNGADPGEAGRFANFAAAHLVSVHGARLAAVEEYAEIKRRFRSHSP